MLPISATGDGSGVRSSQSGMSRVFVISVGSRFELDSGVCDREVGIEAVLKLIEEAREVAVVEATVVNHDVSCQYGQATSYLVGMQIVHVTHVRDAEQPPPYPGKVQALWC